MKEKLLFKDLPVGLYSLMMFYWSEEEPTGVDARKLPESERVEAFIKWFLDDNYDWFDPANKKINDWLYKHGYSPFSGNNQEQYTFDLDKDYQESKKKLAKELGKPVELLTDFEKDEALNRIGLSVLDLDIP